MKLRIKHIATILFLLPALWIPLTDVLTGVLQLRTAASAGCCAGCSGPSCDCAGEGRISSCGGANARGGSSRCSLQQKGCMPGALLSVLTLQKETVIVAAGAPSGMFPRTTAFEACSCGPALAGVAPRVFRPPLG